VRAFLINPYRDSVEELEIEPTPDHLDDLVGGVADKHWIVDEVFPDCVGYVNTYGLTQKRRMWFFHNVHIWGSMVILDPEHKITLKRVRDVCGMRTITPAL
jgi:hypothetical protein